MATAKDTQGSYTTGQPMSAAPGTTLWGAIAVVVSDAMASGNAIVGSFRRGAALYRRGAIRVELGQPNDYFLRNMTAIRAELRELLAVFKPSAFCKVTGLTTP
jgi:HK97 family phage major capsid protein